MAEQRTATNLDNLPNPVLLRIVRNLGGNDEQKLRRVSTKWHKLIDEAFSIHLPLTNENHNSLSDPEIIPAAAYPRIQQPVGYHVQMVDLVREPNLSPAYANLIQSITMSGLIVPFNLRMMMEQCQNTTKLILAGGDPSESTRPGSDLPLTLPQLRELFVLWDCFPFRSPPQNDPTTILEFLENSFDFPQLEKIDISHEVWKRDDPITTMTMPLAFEPEFWPSPRRHDPNENRDPDPAGLLVQPLTSPSSQRKQVKCPLLILLSKTPKLKILRFRNISPDLYKTLGMENNLNLLNQIRELPLEVITLDMSQQKTNDMTMMEYVPLPKFLLYMTQLQTLQVPVRLNDYPKLITMITQNARTLEALDLLICFKQRARTIHREVHERFDPGDPLALVRAFRYFMDLRSNLPIHELDLQDFAPMNNLKILIINRTEEGTLGEKLTSIQRLPNSLHTFVTNFEVSLSDLNFVARNMGNLEVFKALKKPRYLLDDEAQCEIAKTFYCHHPNHRALVLGPQHGPTRNPPIRIPTLTSELQFPTKDQHDSEDEDEDVEVEDNINLEEEIDIEEENDLEGNDHEGDDN